MKLSVREKELIDNLKRGEIWAFIELFNSYKDKIYNFTLRMTQDRELSLDLTQEIFLKVYQKRKKIRGDSNFKSWVFTIARNMCLNALRDSKKQRALNSSGKEVSSTLFSSDIEMKSQDPYENFNGMDLKAKVKRALAGLGEGQREVLILKEYHGLSYDQIAQITQTSLASVKSLLFRARQNLKKIFEKLDKKEKNL